MMGDIYRHLDQLEPRMLFMSSYSLSPIFMLTSPILSCSHADIADQRNLMPMYQKLHSSIRNFDNDHILFFEPTIIITSVSQLFSFPDHHK